jgi:hypothetical protein
MIIVHDDDLALLNVLGDGAVSRSLYCTIHCIDILAAAVTRISPTRCNVRLPTKLQASDS